VPVKLLLGTPHPPLAWSPFSRRRRLIDALLLATVCCTVVYFSIKSFNISFFNLLPKRRLTVAFSCGRRGTTSVVDEESLKVTLPAQAIGNVTFYKQI